MPGVAITSANSGEGGAAGPYKEPHERENGPWEDHELEMAGRDMERGDQVKGNPKLVEAVAKHHEKKAKKHRKMAQGMRDHMKRGMISEKAFDKASKSRDA